MKIHGLLIAAGASRRLGQPKQLVQYQGQTLIDHAVGLLQSAGLDGFTVVLGSKAEEIKSTLSPDISILINERWEEGMGTTISAGVASLESDVDAVLILLVDQYRLSEDLLNQMIQKFKESKDKLIVCQYRNDAVGPPAIFHKKYFNQLADLKGDRGAGGIIKNELKNNSDNIIIMEFREGHLDVDVPADLDQLNK